MQNLTDKERSERLAYLLDVAIESVKLMQSAYILMFFLYETQRYTVPL